MSETKLVVRDAERDVSMTCHGSDAHRAVAALSADPVTIAELGVALERFMAIDQEGFFYRAPEFLDDEPWDSGLVVIDLAARLIVIESTYFATGYSGHVYYQNGEYSTNVSVGYVLADEWRITCDSENWLGLAETRRHERAAKPPVDARAVLYGTPLIEFVAKECWNARYQNRGIDAAPTMNPSASGLPSLASPTLHDQLPPTIHSEDERSTGQCVETLKEIHASWLMTPRDELQGRTPREVLLADRERLSTDMQQRCDQWAHTQECPRGLDATSFAFRFAGFGTHEIVKYYDLVRELLWSCWEQFSSQQKVGEGSAEVTSLKDYLTSETARLERLRDEWLNTPDPECHLRTPQSLIDRERARLPEALFGRDAMIDPDCPCCQMLAELPGPTFLHLDGSAMDWEFPFDIYCQTREEWDAEQREYAQFCASQPQDPPRFEISAISADSDPYGSVWTRTFSMAESTELPLSVRLIGIGWHVAELVIELRELSGTELQIDELNRDFRNLREVLGDADEPRRDALLDPVLERFDQTLGNLSEEHPELEARCCDLSRKIQSFREPQTPVSS